MAQRAWIILSLAKQLYSVTGIQPTRPSTNFGKICSCIGLHPITRVPVARGLSRAVTAALGGE